MSDVFDEDATATQVMASIVSDADLKALVEGNNIFAFDLYRLLVEGAERPKNFFYSPYSLSLALAMTYLGARGETAREMAEALHFTLPQARLHSAFSALDLALARRGVSREGQDDEAFRLHIANAIWAQCGYAFLQPFLDGLAQNYGAGLRLLDFKAAPEEARVTINAWVSEQTEGKIMDLISQGAIDALTCLVLTNAIYFKAAWASFFATERTEDSPFHLLSGEQVMVPMMYQTASFRYAVGPAYQAVELPYAVASAADGPELAMLIILPSPYRDDFAAFAASLDAARVDEIVASLGRGMDQDVALTMPKFTVESASLPLGGALSALGMPSAFSYVADFSGMTTRGERLYIHEVLQKAFIEVDEVGTEAAAATAVIISALIASPTMPPEPFPFIVDRPFVFFIRDTSTGAILFIGHVVNPSV